MNQALRDVAGQSSSAAARRLRKVCLLDQPGFDPMGQHRQKVTKGGEVFEWLKSGRISGLHFGPAPKELCHRTTILSLRPDRVPTSATVLPGRRPSMDPGPGADGFYGGGDPDRDRVGGERGLPDHAVWEWTCDVTSVLSLSDSFE